MPYKLKGNCVVKADTGETVKCHSDHASALAHLKALYANVDKEAGTEPSPTSLHGPGGILSKPGQGGVKKKKKKKMLTPKEFAETYHLAEKDFSYASAETWVVNDAAQAFSYLMSVARQEIGMQEQDDTREILDMMRSLLSFMSDQLDEADTAMDDTSEESDTASPWNGMGYKEQSEKSLGGYLVTESDGTQHLPTRVNGKLDPHHLAAARAALTSNYRGHAYSGPNKSGALAKLRKLYKQAGLDWEEKEFKSQFITTKEGDDYRWVLITGSAFEDKDQEIIAEKAFERDCDEMELTGSYGELLWWHCDGTQHPTDKEARPYLPLGKCDLSLVYEKLNIESGTYYDPEVGLYFEAHSKEYGASKSFYHKDDEPVDGVYTFIRTKERSLLPRGKEANLLTRLFGTKEKEMADNKARLAALEKAIGKEKAEQVLAQGKDLSEKAAQFLASKEQKEESKEETQTEEKDTGITAETLKEFQTAMVAMKEASDKVTASLKEQSESLAALKEIQAKELSTVKGDIAQLQGTVASLMGFQPKGFKASEQGKAPELTKEQKEVGEQMEKAYAGAPKDVIDFVLAGTPFAAS